MKISVMQDRYIIWLKVSWNKTSPCCHLNQKVLSSVLKAFKVQLRLAESVEQDLACWWRWLWRQGIAKLIRIYLPVTTHVRQDLHYVLLRIFSRAASEGRVLGCAGCRLDITVHANQAEHTQTNTHTSPDQLLITTTLSYIRVSLQ